MPIPYGTMEPTRNPISEQDDSASDFNMSNTWGNPDDKDKVVIIL